ncbi:MAG: GIY-YIG nuclease family protein [Patescibacteria group bacterium]|nr:GIY-YIG nuclease family protein [Patescibacteria group bacterium]
MFYLYIIKSKKDRNLYIGITPNLRKRFREHNASELKSTRYRRPFTLVYYESYYSFEDTKEREKKLKQFKNTYTELKKRISHSLAEIEKVVGG